MPLRLSCLEDSCSIQYLGFTSTLRRYSSLRPSLTMTFTFVGWQYPMHLQSGTQMIYGVRLSEARQT